MFTKGWPQQFLEHIHQTKNDGQAMKESRTHHALNNFPHFQAGQHMWGFELPSKTSTGYQNTGKTSRRQLADTRLSKGKSCPRRVAIPASRTKFQHRNPELQLGEITSEDGQSPGKKEPRELTKNLQQKFRCSARGCWRPTTILSTCPPRWARWLPAPGAERVSNNAAISARGFLWIYSSGKKQLLNPQRSLCAEVLWFLRCPGWVPSAPRTEVWWQPRN